MVECTRYFNHHNQKALDVEICYCISKGLAKIELGHVVQGCPVLEIWVDIGL